MYFSLKKSVLFLKKGCILPWVAGWSPRPSGQKPRHPFFVWYLMRRIQAISKMQITFKDKARADEKAQHTRECEHFEEARNTVIGR